MSISVKICGLKDPAQLAAAVDAGARYIGFNFFPKSPRSVTVDQAAALMLDVPMGVAKVALVVNMEDAEIDKIVNGTTADMIQLHGAESPERVAEVKARFGLPVIKAIGIAGPEDTAQIDLYAGVADQLLIDAKAPKGADLPGGNGVPFDWRLVQRKYWPCPWMLAGGLTPDNVAEAIRLTGAKQVDVSSGVETAPGVKDPALVKTFIANAHTATP
ncbi:phosphoribosylanthranilate isomerase [Aliiroseovarius halocynthiae]|uniref:N-(5'-phosphoribosyl)anthranilate isomerase n=1 Tax=Aliiroseovarius halocynthiae TaxID=985055 RepID=A0A545SYG6_9RHOB|nr:phosphoribosylanthranilate isomerase [Aliiroseovarius halocynthiae]TQV70007.1 phosphoribosylanthranilate isomerase [Aliiroseovarius halocynthiae]SMR70675.1 phosphoribosylanthranilate isomerase [Aliiroseovarius halocynthiae]